MLFDDDNYSTFITWTKTLLPIAALALLSTLFMFSGKVDVTQSLPYAELNVDEIIREQRISRPYFTGISETGTQIALSAAFATPDPGDQNALTISTLSAQLTTQTGQEVSILADQGRINSQTQTATMEGQVNISASNGFWIQTDALHLDIKAGNVESPGEIVANSPLGRVEAGSFTLQGTANNAQFVFTNGVRLLYLPKSN